MKVIDLEQVVDRGTRLVKANLSSGVSYGAFEFLLNTIDVVHQQHATVWIIV